MKLRVRSEVGRTRGQVAAFTLLDAEKCYDHVSHEGLATEAHETESPLQLLRFCHHCHLNHRLLEEL